MEISHLLNKNILTLTDDITEERLLLTLKGDHKMIQLIGFEDKSVRIVGKANIVTVEGGVKRLNINQLKVKTLICPDQKLRYLNTRENADLEELFCNKNQLKELDLRFNFKLRNLDCSFNQISHFRLPLPNWPNHNRKFNLNLETLICKFNSIDNIYSKKYPNLRFLDCSNNNLRILDVKDNFQLEIIRCRNNKIHKVFMHKYPEDTRLVEISYDGNELYAD